MADEVKKNQVTKLTSKLIEIIKRKREEWRDRDQRLRILTQFEAKSKIFIEYFVQKKCEAVSRIRLPPDTSKDEKLVVGRTNARSRSNAPWTRGKAASF